MEKQESGYLGHFNLMGFSEALPDGQFAAHFSVIESDAAADLSATGDTGLRFATEEQAADAGLQAARAWAERYRPEDREGRN